MTRLRTLEADTNLRALVRDLATSGNGQDVLAMYVDLDPSEFATAPARKSGITAAIDEASRHAPDARWQPLLDDLRSAFEATDYEIDGASGLLVYGTSDGDATIVKLPSPVTPSVGYHRTVPVRPLIEALEQDRWLVLLCNRRASRILIGDRTMLEELSSWRDDVEGQHDQGGWSQARYQRNIEEQVHEHVRDTARTVQRLHEEGMFDRLLIGGPVELRSMVEGELDDQVARCLSGFVDVDVEHTTSTEVLEAARHCIVEYDDRRDDQLLEQLEEQLGRGTRAAGGLDAVLAAARELRIDTLVVAEGHAAPGWHCAHGDWADTRAGTCPTHGDELEPVADVVEVAVEQAIAAGSHVRTIRRLRDGDAEADDRTQYQRIVAIGSTCALLRFDLEETADDRVEG